MSQTSQNPAPLSPAWGARRVPESLRIEAAAALVGPEAGDPLTAGRRFVQSAPGFGIDLDLMFATIEPGRSPSIGHVALAVLGAGRTAMLFVSSGSRVADDREERVAAIERACQALGEMGLDRVRIAQALPEPDQPEVHLALLDAGFMDVGRLAYLRRSVRRSEGNKRPSLTLPQGIEVRPIQGIERWRPDHAMLARALERSYEETLDCPELCGLRAVEDVIDSHRAAGQWRADLWWLVLDGGDAEGCILLNPCPEQDTVELVYLGLSPALRGRGIGRALLERAIPHAARLGVDSITCAVDRRNAPAMALYKRLGFEEFSSRDALVRAFT